MRIALAVVTSVMFAAVPAGAQDDGLRYIASNKEGLSGFPLWTNRVAFNTCIRALTRGGTPQDVRMFCEEGFSGIKPKVGTVTSGVQVELLDSQEYGDMAHIRVFGGPLKGETGCIAATGLTRIKQE